MGKIEIVPEAEWIERKNDPIDVPTLVKPILAIRDQVEVFPDNVNSVRLYYLRKPATMVFGYTEDDDDVVYSSGTSTQCDWPESAHQDILLRAAGYLGFPLNDDLLIKLKDYKRKTEGV